MSTTSEKPKQASLDEKRDLEKLDKLESEHVQVHSKLAPGEHVTMSGEAITLTWKTCLVIFILSSTFGLSFWPVPTTAAMQGRLAASWNDPTAVAWFIPAYTTGNALGFIVAGTNSDLFGRRIFLIAGNIICCIGCIVTATSHSSNQFIAGLAITGFGGGFCQMAMCAIPELMPNKYRHIGICISDGFIYIIVVIGPIVGRYAIDSGDRNWQYIYWVGFILQFLSLICLYLFYYPPKHPRGVPWKDAIQGLDYVGTLLVIPGICLVLVGIINTTYKSSSDVTVVAPMCVGFGVLVVFGLWETFSNVKYPLCPPHIFRYHHGREFTVPFILAFIVTMFYYGVNIIYPTMINVFYLTPETSRSEELLLTLPGNLGLVFGACLLMAFGNLIGHWKWTLTVAWCGMTLFGGLMAMVTPYNKGTMIAFTFLMQMCFGWAQYESIAFTQLGVPQEELGISGGLAGVARYAGGSLASAVFTTVLTNAQTSRAAATVPKAAISLGMSPSNAQDLLTAIVTGSSSIEDIPGLTNEILSAATTAFKWSYAHGLKMSALTSLAFAGVGLICCLLCENIDAKMNNKTEIFLENDVHKDKNKYH